MAVTWFEGDVLAVVERLLGRWRGRPVGHTSPRDDPSRYDAWEDCRAGVEAVLSERRGPALRPDERAGLELAVEAAGLAEVDTCHAVAWGIDDGRHADLVDLWRRRLVAVGERELEDGDLVAVGDAPASFLPSGARFSTHPNSYKVSADDLPHLRRFRYRGVRVVVDATLDAPLEAVVETLGDRGFASVHPNASGAELVGGGGTGRGWPLRPANGQRQLRRIEQGLQGAGDAGLVVLPELTVTDDLVAALRLGLEGGGAQWEDRLIVAGSAHEQREGRRCNVGYVIVPGTRSSAEYRKNRAWRDSTRGLLEGIAPEEPPCIRLFTAGRYRFAALVCLDLLDRDIARTVGDLGVTVVAAPAMSDKTDGFVAAAHGLVKDAQSLVVVANGPVRTGGDLVVHGRPLATMPGPPQVTGPVVVFPGERRRPRGPGLYLHDLGSGRGRWRDLGDRSKSMTDS